MLNKLQIFRSAVVSRLRCNAATTANVTGRNSVPYYATQLRAHIWTQNKSSHENDSPPSQVSPSKMEEFTNKYLYYEEANDRNEVCRNEIFNGFHDVRTPAVLKSVLLSTPNAIRFAMCIREDLMSLKRQSKEEGVVEKIRCLDTVLVEYLSCVFSRNMLTHQRITFEHSSGLELEKLAEAEAVHKIRALSEMKKRLSSKGRRCFALYHPCLDNDPLTFVHISLSSDITTSMRDIYKNEEIDLPSCAIYYSINSPHASLGGLNIAESLLKRTALELSRLHPTIHTHSTLSPIPGFMKWLSQLQSIPRASPSDPQVPIPSNILETIRSALQMWPRHGSLNDLAESELLDVLRSTLSVEGWHTEDNFCDAIKLPLLWLCHYYLLEAKASSKNSPLDPVARFHLRNGAILHQVNWLANTDTVGMKSSAGMMVNYRYDLSNVESIKQKYQNSGGCIPTGDSVTSFLS